MNKARQLLEDIRKTHFDDELFPLLPKATDDERKHYMLLKLDQMICVDYETLSMEKTMELFLRIRELNGGTMENLQRLRPDQLPDDVKNIFRQEALKDPNLLWMQVWKDPQHQTPRPGCPLFDPKLLARLTADECIQVQWVKDYTRCLGCIQKAEMVPLEVMVPGMQFNIVRNLEWNPIDDFNFQPDLAIERFIRLTQYQRVAAALAHVVLAITIRELSEALEYMPEQEQQWAQECIDFLTKEDETSWFHFSATFMPPRQYIARAHALMHTAELDYHLNETLMYVK